MSAKIESIHALAASLAEGESEAEWRSASSRAYYAAYHRALISVVSCPENSHLKMGSHERITDRFLLDGSNAARSIAYVLGSMKKQRHIADYEIDGDFFQCYARSQVSNFDALSDRLDSFDALSQVKSA